MQHYALDIRKKYIYIHQLYNIKCINRPPRTQWPWLHCNLHKRLRGCGKNSPKHHVHRNNFINWHKINITEYEHNKPKVFHWNSGVCACVCARVCAHVCAYICISIYAYTCVRGSVYICVCMGCVAVCVWCTCSCVFTLKLESLQKKCQSNIYSLNIINREKRP